MSLIFQLQERFPVINSNDTTAVTGEKILIFGTSFNQNILQISGQDIYNSSNYFNVYGQRKGNVSGIDNTLYLDAIDFTIPTGIQKTKYNISVFNGRGQSTNTIELNVLDNPVIIGLEKASGFPDEYIRVTGNYFYPAPNLFFIDSRNNKIFPSDQSSGLYRITGYDLVNVGTGYISGEKISIDSAYHKLFAPNSTGILEVASTGISGSIASLNILNSGLFTLIPTGFDLQSQIGNGNGASIILNYETFEYTGFNQFIEFKIPRNITKNQAIFIENLKYKAPTNLTINDVNVSKTGFQVLGNPKIYGIDPLTGYNGEGYIRVSGENLTFVTGLNLGPLKNINFNYDNDDILFQIPYLATNNKINVISSFEQDTSDSILQVLYREIDASGFNPNDILLSGGLISISGRNLHRINYLNLGQQNISRDKITVNYVTGSTDQASFILPDNYITNEIYAYSLDYPNSGAKIISPATNDRLIASVRLNPDLINLKYFSGIEAAKYLDEVEIYTPVAYSGDYGNLTDSEIFFNTPTGKANVTGCYIVSGIKVANTSTGIKIKIPREIQNPRAQIKVRRNKFGDEYILPSNKSFDILPTIIYNPSSNIQTNPQGRIIVSGINASNANQLFFSGNSGTTNIFGFKNIGITELNILDKQISGITGGPGPNYTYFQAVVGGDIKGTGKLFLFNNYYDTGIGYENNILSSEIAVRPIVGFKPPNSPIFTSPNYVNSPLDELFLYKIQTNSRASSFSFNITTSSGIDDNAIFPEGISSTLTTNNEIFGTPSSGGIFYFKIRALDGDYPNEGMILAAGFGYSGRSVVGPSITYRGDWDTGIIYVGNNLRRDVVKYPSAGINYWYAAKTNNNSAPTPSNPNWIAFSNEFGATATQILLAERSNITTSLNIGTVGIPSGFIKSVNDTDLENGSGFFLGYDNDVYNPGLPKFRVGTTGGYIKFDGLGLNIVGPLSGLVTSSRNVVNANNVVESAYSITMGYNNIIESGSDNSIAIGLNNLIHEDTDNSFIFGLNNVITGGKRLAISAGSNNLISGNTIFQSLDSTIVGGVDNQLIGSYSNILGGKGNYVDAVTSGYQVIIGELLSANNLKISGLTGTYYQELILKNTNTLRQIRINYNNNYYSSRGVLGVINQPVLTSGDNVYYSGTYSGGYILSGNITLQLPILGESLVSYIAKRDNFGYDLSVFSNTGSNTGNNDILDNKFYDTSFSLNNIICQETDSLFSGYFRKYSGLNYNLSPIYENIQMKLLITGLNTGIMDKNIGSKFGIWSGVDPSVIGTGQRYSSTYIKFKTPFFKTTNNDKCAFIFDYFGTGVSPGVGLVQTNFRNYIFPILGTGDLLGNGFIEDFGTSGKYWTWDFTSGTRGSGFWVGYYDNGDFYYDSNINPRITGIFLIAKTGIYISNSIAYPSGYIEVVSQPLRNMSSYLNRNNNNSPFEIYKPNYNFFYDMYTGDDNYKIYTRLYTNYATRNLYPQSEINTVPYYQGTGWVHAEFQRASISRLPEYKINFIASTPNTGIPTSSKTGVLILPHDTSSELFANSFSEFGPSIGARYIVNSGFILPLSGIDYNKNSTPSKSEAFELIKIPTQYSNFGTSTGFFNAVKCNQNVEDIINVKFSVIIQAPTGGFVSGIDESFIRQQTVTGFRGFSATASTISGSWVKRNFYVTVARSGIGSTSWEDLAITNHTKIRSSNYVNTYLNQSYNLYFPSSRATMFNNFGTNFSNYYQNLGYTWRTGIANPDFNWKFVGGNDVHTGLLDPNWTFSNYRSSSGELWNMLINNPYSLSDGFWLTGAKSGDVFKLTCQLYGGLGVVVSGMSPNSYNNNQNQNLIKLPVTSGGNCLIFDPTINISQYPKNKFFIYSNTLYANAATTGNTSGLFDPVSGLYTIPGFTGYITGGDKIDYILTKNINTIYAPSSDYVVSRAEEVGFNDVGSSTILGGTGNYLKGFVNTIGGGVKNTIIGDYNTIPGGRSNKIIDDQPILAPKVVFSAILGGNNNLVSGNVTDGVVIGGEYNSILNDTKIDDFQTIGQSIIGGKSNILSGTCSTIVGGQDNYLVAPYSYVLGRNVTNNKSGSLVIADGSDWAKTTSSQIPENSAMLMFRSGIYLRMNTTAAGFSGISPLNLNVLELPTNSAAAPIGGVFRSGNVLCIRTS